MSGLSDVMLEPVIEFSLHRERLSFSICSKQKTSLSKDIISLEDYPYLKAGITFAPHGSSEDILPANRSSEIAATVRKEQDCLHKDVALEQLEEIILPRAIDYFRQNAKAMAYQILWKSKHGFALIYVEKPCINTRRSSMRTRSTFGGARKKNYGQDEEVRTRRCVSHWIDLLVSHVMPVRLQRLLMNWLQKEKEIQLASTSATPIKL
jgi:hypothetical protein